MVSTRRFGRLGNELYQYAALIGYSIKHGLEWSLPNETNEHVWNPIHFPHLHNDKWVNGREDILINENGHHYQEILFKEEWRDLQIVLNGYWQSFKYFDFCRDEVLKIFSFPYEFKKATCSLHIRRGDYLMYPAKHPVITDDYIAQAISIIKEKGINKFYVFGDDLNWNLDNVNKGIY